VSRDFIGLYIVLPAVSLLLWREQHGLKLATVYRWQIQPNCRNISLSDVPIVAITKSDSIYQELFPVMLSRDTKLVPVTAVPDESVPREVLVA
jgi:hypothetical protein